MKFLAPFLTVILWVSSLQGQVVRLESEYQVCADGQMCRIERTAGSAVNIGRVGDKWLFVSAGHLFHGDNWDNPAGIKVLSASVNIGGQVHTATLVRYFISSKNALDLSFWEVECNQHDCRPYSLIDEYPKTGTGMQVSGFSSGSPVPRPITFWGLRSGWVATTHDTAPGDSGGALLYQGAVAGIVSGGGIGSDPIPGRHTSSVTVLRYVKKYFPQASVTVYEPPIATQPPIRTQPVPQEPDIGGDDPPAVIPPKRPRPDNTEPPAQDPVTEAPQQQPSDSPVESLINSPITTGLVGLAGGGAGTAALFGIRSLLALRRKRKERKRKRQSVANPDPPQFPAAETPPKQETREPVRRKPPCPELPQRSVDEAGELTKLGQLEGRNPLLDAVGFVHFEDLREHAPAEDRAVLDKYFLKIREHIDVVAPVSYRTKG